MNAKQKWVLGAVAFLLLLAIAGFGYQELQTRTFYVNYVPRFIHSHKAGYSFQMSREPVP